MSGGVTQAGGARLVLVEVWAGVAGGEEAGLRPKLLSGT